MKLNERKESVVEKNEPVEKNIPKDDASDKTSDQKII